jgi:flagellum-specific peptidoglycan hydrolase FlgJ
VADLAAYYGSELSETLEVNGIEPPYVILVGQRLLMPGGKMPLSDPEPEQRSGGQAAPPTAPEVQAPRESGALASSVELSPAPRPLPRPTNATGQQASFIRTAAEAARESQRVTGVPASVTIAQAILESYWGSSRLSRENNNYFGIKARERPGTAGVVWYDVWEVVNGANVVQSEPFRAYKTAADSFVDHGLFFQQNGRYAAALAASADPQQFAREINAAGYATDPSYAPKLIGLMDRFNLYAYDLK